VSDITAAGVAVTVVGRVNDQGQVLIGLQDGGSNRREVNAVWHRGGVTRIFPDGARGPVGDISDRGQVVGTLYEWDGTLLPYPHGDRPFSWSQGQLSFLPTGVGDRGGAATRVNGSGQVIGHVSPGATGAPCDPALWDGGELVVLDDLPPGSTLVDINDRGQVAVTRRVHGEEHAAIRHPDGEVVELGSLGDGAAGVVAITEKGDVVANVALPGRVAHAVVWRDGRMTDLGTLGGPASWAVAVNDHGHVAGWADLADGQTRHAFLWRDGEMIDLAPPGDLGPWPVSSRAVDLNDDDQVVGVAETASPVAGLGAIRALLWQDGEVTDLGAGVEPGAQSYPCAINDHGHVTGVVATEDTEDADDELTARTGGRPVLWTVPPAPSPLVPAGR
jgi:probable HAF family extracellular repeat protein